MPRAAMPDHHGFASNAPRKARNSEMKTHKSGRPIAVIAIARKTAA